MSLAHNPVGRGKGDGHGTVHELSGTMQLNSSLEILDLTDCDLNGYGSGGRGIDKAMERLLWVMRNNLLSANLTNIRMAGNKRMPVALLKMLRDTAQPPLVIDLVMPNKPLDLS